MRVSIRCEDVFNREIGKHMEREGDVVSNEDADFLLTDQIITSTIPKIVIGGEMSTSLLEMLDITKKEGIAFVSKWFDRFNGWSEQMIVSIPIYGMMNEGMGAPVLTGVALRFIDNSPLQELFLNDLLEETLRQQKHTGFISINITEMGHPCGISYGIPNGGNLVILEGCKQRLAEFFTCPERLMESWAVGLFMTRYPYPFTHQTENVHVDGLDRSMNKHIYTPFIKQYRNSYHTDNTMIALCTSWDKRLIDANKRALGLCNKISVPLKQHRTDLNCSVQHIWARLHANDLIIPAIEILETPKRTESFQTISGSSLAHQVHEPESCVESDVEAGIV